MSDKLLISSLAIFLGCFSIIKHFEFFKDWNPKNFFSILHFESSILSVGMTTTKSQHQYLVCVLSVHAICISCVDKLTTQLFHINENTNPLIHFLNDWKTVVFIPTNTPCVDFFSILSATFLHWQKLWWSNSLDKNKTIHLMIHYSYNS